MAQLKNSPLQIFAGAFLQKYDNQKNKKFNPILILIA